MMTLGFKSGCATFLFLGNKSSKHQSDADDERLKAVNHHQQVCEAHKCCREIIINLDLSVVHLHDKEKEFQTTEGP